MKGMLALIAEQKMKYANILDGLTTILKNRPLPRVAQAAPTRVDKPSMSNNTTAPRVLCQANQIHQKKTRSNTPMPSITEDLEVEVAPPPSEWSDNWYQQPRINSQQKKPSKKRVISTKPCKPRPPCGLPPGRRNRDPIRM